MISVIIPVYNVEEFLPDCLFSILNQTFQDFEVICIDDGSTDSTLDILNYFSKFDSRIKFLTNEHNRGPGYSRNRGLDIAQKKYICFLDSDDWLSFNAFEILVQKAEENNLDVLMFKNLVYYEDLHTFGTENYYEMDFMSNWESKVFTHWDLDKTKLFDLPNPPWNKFYLRSFLNDNNIRFPNENLIHEDNPFFYKIITSAKRISFTNEYIHNRRRRDGSIMTLNNERLFDNIDISYKILNVFIESDELYAYYKKEVLTYISSMLFGKYQQIENKFKKEFFKQTQLVFKSFVNDYGIYEDIINIVDENILNFFKFDEIVQRVNDNPKISVVIPVYNVENYLCECLDSVCNQTFRDIEIICVNDGSTDDSLYILEEYRKKDSRVSIITQKNQGLSGARNTGLMNSNGKYVYFIDSDDYLDLNALNEIYTISEEKNLDMLIFKICSFKDDTKEKFTSPYFEMKYLKEAVGENVFNYRDIGYKMYNLAVTVPGAFFRLDLIAKLRFPVGLIFEDNLFFTEAILNANRVFFYDKFLYNYRTRENSISTSGSKNFSDIIEIRNKIIDLAKKYDNYEGSEEFLYNKKLSLIQFRFLQTSNEYKEKFYNKIHEDFLDKKDEYLHDSFFLSLPEQIKNIFFAGLNSDNYMDFEEKIKF